MRANKATQVFTTSFQATCPCGGAVVDTKTGSLMLIMSDLNHLGCQDCLLPVQVTVKTARIV